MLAVRTCLPTPSVAWSYPRQQTLLLRNILLRLLFATLEWFTIHVVVRIGPSTVWGDQHRPNAGSIASALLSSCVKQTDKSNQECRVRNLRFLIFQEKITARTCYVQIEWSIGYKRQYLCTFWEKAKVDTHHSTQIEWTVWYNEIEIINFEEITVNPVNSYTPI